MNRKCKQVLRIGLWAGALALVGAGCSGGAVDIGDEGDGGDQSNGTKLSAFAGSYDGEIELWEADSGSSRIRIELDEDGHGSVRFGDRAIQSAPDHPYPDDESLPNGDSFGSEPLETAIYPVHEPSLEEGTLEFFVEMGDLFDDFCETQADPALTPPCVTPDLVGWGSEEGECYVKLRDPDDPDAVAPRTPIACSRSKICYEFRACECDQEFCEAVDFHQIHFRMQRKGGQVTGDVRFNSEPLYWEIEFD